MPATLLLRRGGAVGIELRRAPFEITIDGHDVGSIKPHETFDAELAPGAHTLKLHAGRYSSPQRRFEAGDGELVRFRCHGPMVWPRFVASLFAPGLGIALKDE